MGSLYIVLIGGGKRIPDVEDYESALRYASSFEEAETESSEGFDVHVHIVDPHLSSNESIETKALQELLPGVEFSNMAIQRYRHSVKEPIDERPFDPEDPTSFVKRDIRETLYPVIFIDYTNSSTRYQTMEKIGTVNPHQRWYIPTNEQISLLDLVKSYTAGELSQPYDIYSGDKVPDSVSQTETDRSSISLLEREHIRERILEGVLILKSYIEVGFHLSAGKFGILPEPYMMNMETPFLKWLTKYHSLLPVTRDREPSLEFATNPQYRKVITDTMIKILSNFAIANSIIAKEDAKESGGWHSVSTWVRIEYAIRAWRA